MQRGYSTNNNVRAAVNRLHVRMHCCGVDSYLDWLEYGEQREDNSDEQQ